MIKLEKVNIIYSDGTHALKDINLEFNNCGLVYIKGKSGSGKSSLLNIIAGLSKITSGQLLFNNKTVNSANLLKERITYVGQDHNLVSFLTIKDNLDINNNYNEDIIKSIGIEKIINKRVSDISGGEAKKVEIARGLLDKSSILICDEPINALDSNNSNLIMKLLKEISINKLVIITGHNDSIIETYADRVIEIENGKIIQDNNKENSRRIDNSNYKKKDNILSFVNGLFLDKLKKNIIYIFLFTILFSLLFIFFNILMNNNQLDSSILVNQNINRTYYMIDSSTNIYNMSKFNKTNKLFSESKIYYKNEEPININVNNSYSEYPYYQALYNDLKFTIINKDTFSSKDIIVGNLPINGNEILISEYYYNCLKYLGVLDSSITDSIGRTIMIDDYNFIIVGILKQDIKKYDFIKKTITTDNAYLLDLMDFFNYGISSVDTIFVSNKFEEYIDFDKSITELLIYNSTSYYDLLSLKNSLKDNHFHNTDMFYEYVNRYQSILNPIRNITLIGIVIVLILTLVIIYDYLLNVVLSNKKDFYSLYYCCSSNNTIYKIISRIIVNVCSISIILGLVICYITLRFMNSFINTFTGFIFNVLRFDLLTLSIIIVIIMIYTILVSFLIGKKIIIDINKQYK